MAPAARPLKRRPSSSARVAGRCWTSVSGASLSVHVHRLLFAARFGGFERAEKIHGPVRKHRAAVNKLTGNRTKDARIVRADAVVAQNKKVFFFFNDTATTEIYTLSLHDALPIVQN